MTTPALPRPLDHRFTAPLQKDGSYPTYLTVPDSEEILGTRRAVRITGTIDGHPLVATLMPSGNGPHWLPIRKKLCAAIGKDRAGDRVTVHLEQRLS